MMRLNRYDIEFHYVKGVQLYLADTLSRAYFHTDEKNMHTMMAESVIIPDQRMIGRNYLIVIDFFSNFFEVDLSTTTTST